MILKKSEIIIILIALFIVIIYTIIYFDLFHDLGKNHKNINLENFKKNLKTGDLLFFPGNHFNHRLIKFYSNSYFSHVAIVLKGTTKEEIKDNKIFIIEADIGGDYKSGTRILPLEKKLKKEKIVGLLPTRIINSGNFSEIERSDLLAKQLLELFDKYQHLTFDNSMISWVVADIPFLYQKVKDNDKIFCSELIAKMLIDLKILDSNKLPSYYSPQKLIDVLVKNKKYDNIEIYEID